MARKLRKKSSARPSVDSEQDFAGIELNRPSTDLMGYTFFFYGPPKIGKSTAALSWPRPIVLATEVKGIKAHKVRHIKIRSWDHMLKAVKVLKKKETKKEFDTVIVDTTDLMYKYCLAYCCEKYGFDHPSDQGWGKGWERLSDEFLSMVLELFDMGYTLIFISHSKANEIKADWEDYTRFDPTLAGPGRKALLPYVDVIVYMRAKEAKGGKTIRTLTTKATREYEAGDRTRHLTDIEVRIPESKKDRVFKVLNKIFKTHLAAE